MTGNHPLYDAAVAADDAFTVELTRLYGRRNAGDMRYQPNRWPDDKALSDAAEAKYDADRAWLNAQRAAS